MRVSELEGAQLDRAVAKIEGVEAWIDNDTCMCHGAPGFANEYSPRQNWMLGGPIIERERIQFYYRRRCVWMGEPYDDVWLAFYAEDPTWLGSTPLVAAMRAFVARTYGDEVQE